jgi:GAF domain-containing protein
MTPEQKQHRYERILAQLEEFFTVTPDPVARMATAAALLKGKMSQFFWIGFYRLIEGQLLVGPYQGPLACQNLPAGKGVCRACVTRNEAIVVPDVHRFPGHIACDARSKSEVVVPCRDRNGRIRAVLDADSDKLNTFDEIDAQHLQTIAAMVYRDTPDAHLNSI